MKDTTFLKGIQIAHRGLFDNKQIPENSKAAFQKALDKCMPIELDLQILKDDTIVVFHDDNLKRMTNYNKEIIECHLEEVNQLRLLQTEERIPLFEDVLKQISGKVLLDIEFKTSPRYKVLLEKAIPLLDAYNGKFLVKSFDPRIVYYLKKHRPFWMRGLLASKTFSNRKKHPIQNYFLSHLFAIPFVKPDFIAYDKRGIRNFKIQSLRKKWPLLVWTIRGKEEYDYYQDYADGYIIENNK